MKHDGPMAVQDGGPDSGSHPQIEAIQPSALRTFASYYVSLLRTSIPLALIDMCGVYLAILLGGLCSQFLFGLNLFEYDRLCLLTPIAVMMSMILQRTYPLCGANPAYEFRYVITATIQAFVFIAGFSLAHYDDGVLVAIVVMSLVGLPAAIIVSSVRSLSRSLLSRYEWWGIPVVMIGDNPQVDDIFHRLKQQPAMGFRPFRLADDLDLEQQAKGVSIAIMDRFENSWDMHRILSAVPNVYLTKADQPLCSLWRQSLELAGHPCQRVQSRLNMSWHRFSKRAIDVFTCAIASLVLIPLVVLIGLAIRITSDGPIFYSQKRLRQNRSFQAWKFRTMVHNADEVLETHLQNNPALRTEWERDHKLRDDPRVTSVGKFLRKTSLDELPQIWNILRGDMSIVGPRPITESEVKKYGDQFIWYAQVKPGLTGLWQVSGRNNTTYEQRVRYDAYYVINWSLWLDAYIFTRTFKTVLFQEGAC